MLLGLGFFLLRRLLGGSSSLRSSGRFAPPTARNGGTAGSTLGQQIESLLESERLGCVVFGKRRVGCAVSDVIAEAAFEQFDGVVGHRRILERLQRFARGGPAATALLGLSK